MLAAILQTAGYKTGLYTSPHLKDFRERIRVNGEMIREQFVVDFTERIQPLVDEIEPSFFEITVAMAFDYFRKEQVDIAIIETGLGGRLDSTNVITPEISVITNIGWDHMAILGDTLEKIAGEKAGIIKENIPVVIGEILPETEPVFLNTAASKSSPLYIATRQFHAMEWKWENHQIIVEVAEEHKTDHQFFQLDLPGLYQAKNLLTVLQACNILQGKGWKTDLPVIHTALKQVRKLTGLHGRWEIIHQKPTVVLDVGHNVDGFQQILKQVEVTDHRELHIILGMVKDKETTAVLQLLPPTAHYYFAQAPIPRAIESTELQRNAAQFKLKGKAYTDVNIAMKEARSKAHPDDLIIVCGSVFLVGEVINQ